MSRLLDLKEEYNETVEVLNSLEKEGKIEEIKEKLAKAKELKDEIETLEEVRNLEIQEIVNTSNKTVGGNTMREYNKEIFNKLLTGKATEEEKTIYNEAITGVQIEGTPADGGYLVPKEQYNQLLEYRRTLNPLDSRVRTIPVKRPSGTMPAQVENTNKLVSVNELAKITATKENFKEITYNCAKYGDVMGVSEELLADTDFNIVGYLQRSIAKKSVRTNNEKIIAKLLAISSPVEVAKKADLETKLIETIYSLDPVFRNGDTAIYTNTEGVVLLEKLRDADGRPLLTDSLKEPLVKVFKGIPVVEISNEELAKQDTNKVPFFIGSLNDFLMKFERQGLEFSASKEAGFFYGATMIRAIERFDYQVADDKAMKYVKVDASK